MSGVSPTDDARCPRCGGGFHCGIDDAQPCACTSIELKPAALVELRRQFSGCLCLRCLRCLRELAAGASAGLPQRAASGNRERMP
jgi:hypothetical protein